MTQTTGSDPIRITILAQDSATEELWLQQLQTALDQLPVSRKEIQCSTASGDSNWGQVFFVDAKIKKLAHVLKGIDLKGRAVFLMLAEGDALPSLLDPSAGAAPIDDVIVVPFRPLEILSRVRHYRQILMWDTVQHLNAGFAQVMEQLRENLSMAERMQKERLPIKFPAIKGVHFAHRYIAGAKAGGDYLDVEESSDGDRVSIVLTDSSSYGLSSAVLSTLMQITSKVSAQGKASCTQIVGAIQSSLLAALGAKDSLSMTYAMLSRKDLVFRYLLLGAGKIYLRSASSSTFKAFQSQVPPLSQNFLWGETLREDSITLQPGDQLLLVSDGFSKLDMGSILGRKFSEPADLLNELSFLAKESSLGTDELPPEDCTALLISIDAKALRLA